MTKTKEERLVRAICRLMEGRAYLVYDNFGYERKKISRMELAREIANNRTVRRLLRNNDKE